MENPKTVKLDEDIKKKLDELKGHERVPYNAVVGLLLQEHYYLEDIRNIVEESDLENLLEKIEKELG